ncbi:MAG: TIGR02757 family protein [Deltaproteobacteria bacterium]|nr:TIGR02757 family protein [Deltaproteobacteria bacterium]
MKLKQELEKIYGFYNTRKWVHPDPLEFLYLYPDPRDMEIVGLIASSLAYGRVAQILKSVSSVLSHMGESPSEYLKKIHKRSLYAALGGFKHRFTNSENIVSMLLGIKNVIKKYGSLHSCFMEGMKANDVTIIPALSFLVKELRLSAESCPGCLLPFPGNGSACKKLNLFLRWMVRKDEVDPGCWEGISPSMLIVPLDTHMHRVSLKLGLTERKSGDIRTALEITEGFKKIAPEDPVKYDFALTRPGIRKDRM